MIANFAAIVKKLGETLIEYHQKSEEMKRVLPHSDEVKILLGATSRVFQKFNSSSPNKNDVKCTTKPPTKAMPNNQSPQHSVCSMSQETAAAYEELIKLYDMKEATAADTCAIEPPSFSMGFPSFSLASSQDVDLSDNNMGKTNAVVSEIVRAYTDSIVCDGSAGVGYVGLCSDDLQGIQIEPSLAKNLMHDMFGEELFESGKPDATKSMEPKMVEEKLVEPEPKCAVFEEQKADDEPGLLLVHKRPKMRVFGVSDEVKSSNMNWSRWGRQNPSLPPNATQLKMGNYVLDQRFPKFEKLFEFEGHHVRKNSFQTLVSGGWLCGCIIDVYSVLLNYYEQFKASGLSLHYFFSLENARKVVWSKHLGYPDRNEIFRKYADEHFNKWNAVKIKEVDLFFFPVHQHEHYYLVCFNVKAWRIDVIDNSAKDPSFSEKNRRKLAGFSWLC